MEPIDVALLVVRVAFGVGLSAHGLNKVFGGGRLAGTGRWFGSMGMRWPQVQARLAAGTEIGAGWAFAAGLLTPLAAAGIVAVMLVALWVAHRRNGFFIFRKGEGWEYTASIAVVAWTVATIGPGTASLDHALGLTGDGGLHSGWAGGLIAGVVGVGSAVGLLAASYRPAAEAR
ncbi:MAG: DoxX family protein [Actinomycetota bacterium]|nr:DoxX family protein [Acidimicrobiia bacterium]MDQ3469520.1 DoxX family protein [Actinomycetota bacterium]